MYAVRSGALAALAFLAVGTAGQALRAADAGAPHGYVGIMVSPAEDGGSGVVVREVTPDSPAAKAGLKKEDRIVKLGDTPVQDVQQFMSAVAARKPGEKLTLGVMRGGKEQNLAVTLGERARQEAPALIGRPDEQRAAFLGVQTMPLTPELKERLKVDGDGGAVVADVIPGSPAARAGLKHDDVITGVNDHAVKDPEALRDAVQKAGPGKQVTLQVFRGKEKLALKATLQPGMVGFFPVPGEEHFPTIEGGPMFDQGRRIRELERRVEELEKQLRELHNKK